MRCVDCDYPDLCLLVRTQEDYYCAKEGRYREIIGCSKGDALDEGRFLYGGVIDI